MMPRLLDHNDTLLQTTSKTARQVLRMASKRHPAATENDGDGKRCRLSALDSELSFCVGLEASVAAHQGKRSRMEDEHIVVGPAEFASLMEEQLGRPPPKGSRLALYGVCDGHGGRGVADFVAIRLPKLVAIEMVTLLRTNYIKVHPWSRTKKVGEAIRRACATVEAELFIKSELSAQGCCCACIVVVQDQCHIVNVGDSRVVLVRRETDCGEIIGDSDVSGPPATSYGHHSFPWDLGQVKRPTQARVISLTVDHRPSDPLEGKRILDAGVKIEDGRVDGVLEVSRSFGDVALKRRLGYRSDDPYRCAISAEPDLRVSLSLDANKDEFFLVACDGLWTKYPPTRAAQFVRTRHQAQISYRDGIRKDWSKAAAILQALVEDAFVSKHCTDNISVLFLRVFHRAQS